MATRIRGALVLAAMLACAPLHAAEVAGVKVEETAHVAGTALKLNGAGLRGKAFIKVYVMGLYLAEKKSSAPDVFAAAGPKRILIHMLRDVDSGSFSDAMEEGIRDNHSELEVQAFAPRMKLLNALMHDSRRGLLPRAAANLAQRPAGLDRPQESLARAGRLRWPTTNSTRR